MAPAELPGLIPELRALLEQATVVDIDPWRFSETISALPVTVVKRDIEQGLPGWYNIANIEERQNFLACGCIHRIYQYGASRRQQQQVPGLPVVPLAREVRPQLTLRFGEYVVRRRAATRASGDEPLIERSSAKMASILRTASNAIGEIAAEVADVDRCEDHRPPDRGELTRGRDLRIGEHGVVRTRYDSPEISERGVDAKRPAVTRKDLHGEWRLLEEHAPASFRSAHRRTALGHLPGHLIERL